MVNTNRSVQGLWNQPGPRVDFRYEYLDQDQPLAAAAASASARFRGTTTRCAPRTATLYGFVQLPLYQYVNGVQLTAGWSAVAGVSVQF
jgi:hypothetical protein